MLIVRPCRLLLIMRNRSDDVLSVRVILENKIEPVPGRMGRDIAECGLHGGLGDLLSKWKGKGRIECRKIEFHLVEQLASELPDSERSDIITCNTVAMLWLDEFVRSPFPRILR